MPALEFKYEELSELAKTFDADKPIYMLNLWRFKETAEYAPEHSAFAGPSPISGQEALGRYRSAIVKYIPEGCEVIFQGTPIANVVALDDERWHRLVIVKYPTLKSFKDMIESDGYKTGAKPHRIAGLADARLIMMDKMEV